MTPYRDWDRDSNIKAFDIGESYIDVEFKEGSVYRYTSLSAGNANIAEMARLARSGDGLLSFINKNVSKRYAAKLR